MPGRNAWFLQLFSWKIQKWTMKIRSKNNQYFLLTFKIYPYLCWIIGHFQSHFFAGQNAQHKKNHKKGAKSPFKTPAKSPNLSPFGWITQLILTYKKGGENARNQSLNLKKIPKKDLKPTPHPWYLTFIYKILWTGMFLNISLMRSTISFAYCRQFAEMGQFCTNFFPFCTDASVLSTDS